MQESRFEDLGIAAAETLENVFPTLDQKLTAKSIVEAELDRMKDQDRILMLSAEEESLLWSFRRFKERVKRPGEVFKWQTTPLYEAVVASVDQHPHVVDPRDMSSGELIMNPGV